MESPFPQCKKFNLIHSLGSPPPWFPTPCQGSTEASHSLQALGRSLPSSAPAGFCGLAHCLSSESFRFRTLLLSLDPWVLESLISWKCVVTSSGYSKGKESRVHRHFSFSSRKMPFPFRGKPTSLFPSGNPAETSGGVWRLQIPTREVSCRQLLFSSFGHVNTPSRQRSMGPYYLSEFRIGCEKRKIL